MASIGEKSLRSRNLKQWSVIEEPVENYFTMQYGLISDVFWTAHAYVPYNMAGMCLSTSLWCHRTSIPSICVYHQSHVEVNDLEKMIRFLDIKS